MNTENTDESSGNNSEKKLKKKPSERGAIMAEKAGDKRGSSMSGKKVVVRN